MSHKGRSFSRCLVLETISEKGLKRNGWLAPEGGTRVMRRLVQNPATATASVTRPMRQAASFQATYRKVPLTMPSTIATKVLISSSALPRERSRSGSISGTMPYLAGLKIVECSPIRNTTSTIPSNRPERNAASPTPMTKISKILTQIRTRRLLTRSDKCPE